MVSDKVEVRTKSPYSEKAYLFRSSGIETYEIEEIENPIMEQQLLVLKKEE